MSSLYDFLKETEINDVDIDIDNDADLGPNIDQQKMNNDAEATRLEFINNNTEQWQENGNFYRQIRKHAGATIREVALFSGFSESKLSSFEHGRPVRNSEVIERIYYNFIQTKSYKYKELLSKMEKKHYSFI